MEIGKNQHCLIPFTHSSFGSSKLYYDFCKSSGMLPEENYFIISPLPKTSLMDNF
jgi:hypothetical protein